MLVAIAVVATGAWYWFTPRRAWNQFVEALALSDATALEQLVDYPRVRTNLKADLRGAIDQRGATKGIAPAVGGVMLDPLVDIMVSPDGMAQLVNTFGTRATATDQTTVIAYRYRSPSRVDVHVRSSVDAEDAAGIFTFERSAISWRLVRVWSERLATSAESP